MATILEFRAFTRSMSAGEQTRGRGVPAEIVFFPGVRYERGTEAAPRKRSESKRRRDKLEIAD